ncbi:MAG: class I SAM-dependent methyltransferase, partial [Terriglobia bacterium]
MPAGRERARCRPELIAEHWPLADMSLYLKLESFITPGLAHAQDRYAKLLEQWTKPGDRWLDVGCGRSVLPSWVRAAPGLVNRNRFGIDPYLSSLRANPAPCKAQARIEWLPFADRTFDVVTANMVVEHLKYPALQFREIWRVLRPGGLFVFHTTNAQGYYVMTARLIPERLKSRLAAVLDGRAQEEVFPAWYRVNTRRAIHETLQAAGFSA